jgi:hypothetical protein
MKKLLGIMVLGLLLSGNAYAKETTLICELKKFYEKRDRTSQKVQIPLNELDLIVLEKEYLVLDFDKKKLIKSSSFIILSDYKKLNFTDDALYFKGHGQDTRHLFDTNANLNRFTGELEINMKSTKALYEGTGSSYKGDYEMDRLYQCKKSKKKF